MTALPLQLRDGHLFVILDDEFWLLDTGAPTSFGKSSCLFMAGEQFNLGKEYLGLTVATLSQFVGEPCAGLIGGDILGHFDHIFDVAGNQLTVSTSELSHCGAILPLDEFMEIPIVTALIGNRNHRMFFDTGAQISYFQDDSLTDYPPAGNVTDFYPGIGQFQTDTHEVSMSLADVAFSLRCGRLPGLLGMMLTMAEATGIIGHTILSNRTVGYFPRRRLMVL